MVDTGASISVLHREVAERLGVRLTDDGGLVNGLSGSVPWVRGTLPSLTLGAFTVEHLAVAVDVPGAPEETGPLPVAGILGNNAWRNWTMVVDYPRDTLELHQPGSYRARGPAGALVVGDNHLFTPVRIVARAGGKEIKARTMLEVDTGAEDLSLWCSTGEPFRDLATVGVEPVIGIGADLDRLPDYSVLATTRRVPTFEVEVAERTIRRASPVRWNSPDETSLGCNVTPGLVGYRVLAPYRVVIDFAEGALTLERPRGRARRFDALAAWLRRDADLHGGAPEFAAQRAKVTAARGDIAGARAILEAAEPARPADAEIQVLLARLDRHDGNYERANERLANLEPGALAGEDEWVAFVNSLALAGRVEDAVARARLAAAEAEDSRASDPDGRAGAMFAKEAFLALSDAELAAGRPAEAQAALDRAIAVDQGGSAYSLRKARIALADGDRYGAIATLRALLSVYPVGGPAMWLYSTITADADRGTFRADLERAVARLHPGAGPLDFIGASWLAVGERDLGLAALDLGYARDCGGLLASSDRDNCQAWYWGLRGERLDEANNRVGAALRAQPRNAAFHDTAAVVAAARGAYDTAVWHAFEAAKLQPWDPYFAWQLRRLQATARGTPG
jgi:tetratricopeptide (TPR) repeat protein